MADLSLSNVLQRRKRIKIITILCGVVLLGAVTAFLVSKNPKETKALTLDASTLTVNNGDVLYIGKDGLQSERVWRDTVGPNNLSERTRLAAAGTGFGPNYRMTRTADLPVDNVYTSNQLVNMNYPAAPCPTTTWADNTTTTYTGDCKAILTDGNGAIVNVSGDIYINGVVFLGDRVILKAKNIIIGPHGKIIGSGQNAHDVLNADNDYHLLGGLGARNGGQAKTGVVGGRIDENPAGNFLYDPNDYNYYYPITDNGDVITQLYFRDDNNNIINGGNGGNGGPAARSPITRGGFASLAGEGIGGGGGSGGADGDSSSGGSAAGGGGGGGYGLCLQAQDITVEAGARLNFRGGNGSFTGDNGGGGGGGGGGVVIFRANNYRNLGTVDVSGGLKGEADEGTDGNPGSDGRVLFFHDTSQPVTIKKTLSPKKRAGVDNDRFNPYALQVDDEIEVKLEVSSYVTGLLTLEDERLSVKYANPPVYCEYMESSFIGPLGAAVDASNPEILEITYNVPPGTTEPLSYSYRCVVKSP